VKLSFSGFLFSRRKDKTLEVEYKNHFFFGGGGGGVGCGLCLLFNNEVNPYWKVLKETTLVLNEGSDILTVV